MITRSTARASRARWRMRVALKWWAKRRMAKGRRAALQPDLVLLDVSMPKGGGLGALGLIMQMEKPPLVAMLTASEDEGDLMAALKAGRQAIS